MPTVAALHVYPVKALRGAGSHSIAVEPWGFLHDRRYLVVDGTGRFLTQREVPAMATLEARVEGGGLRLGADGRASLRCEPDPDAAPLEVTVWRDRVAARPVGAAADAWLTAALGRPCRLVHMDTPERARPVDPAFARPGDHVSFADGFPVLLTSTGSLDDLNGRLPVAIGMDRFRPNLVVAGALPWAEDGWRTLRIGNVVLDLVKPCARCIVTTTDQVTGERSPDVQPIRALQRFRRDAQGQVLFGHNAVPRRCGTVAVGDPVEILA